MKYRIRVIEKRWSFWREKYEYELHYKSFEDVYGMYNVETRFIITELKLGLVCIQYESEVSTWFNLLLRSGLIIIEQYNQENIFINEKYIEHIPSRQ